MALPVVGMNGVIEYAVPQSVSDAAPDGFVYTHLAWFSRRPGRWLGEWAGYVRAPDISDEALGDERTRLLNDWQHGVQGGISPRGTSWPTIDAEWNVDAWDACAGVAVCLDVTRFGWPVGDHVWHRWNDVARLLDWPQESAHVFIEVRMDTLEVVANQRSHRPIRDAVPGQRVFDITGSPMAEHHGDIWGRFVWSPTEHKWSFKPQCDRVPERTRLALSEAPVGLDLVTSSTAVKEKVGV